MAEHAPQVRRRRLEAARAGELEPRVRPLRLTTPVFDPVLGVGPQVLIRGPVVGVVWRPVARGVRAFDGDGVVSKEEMAEITETTLQEWIDEADDDMNAWTVFCNTHCAWSVDDLTPIVAALEIDAKPFFGPVHRGVATSMPPMRRVPFTQVRRADGVFQLYVELPYHHYLEIDSLTFNGTVGTPSAQAWADVV